jgi:hypothetical protein
VGTGTFSLGVRGPRLEAYHSLPSRAEVKEYVELYLHSPIQLHGVVLRAQGQLYLSHLPSLLYDLFDSLIYNIARVVQEFAAQ